MFRCQVACPGNMSYAVKKQQSPRRKKCFCEQFFVGALTLSWSRRFRQGDRFFTQHAANKSQAKVATGAALGLARDKDTNRWRRPAPPAKGAESGDWSDIDSPSPPHNGAWKCSVLVVHTREGCSFLIYLTALCLCSHMQQAIESERARVCVELDNKFRHEILSFFVSPGL